MQGPNALGKLENIMSKLITMLAFVIISILTILSFVFQSRVSMDADSMEKISFHHNNIWVFVFLFVILFLIFILKKQIENVSGKWLFLFLGIIYIFLGILLINGIGTDLRADANEVYQAAVAFSKGDFSMLKVGGYLYHYPHQLGLITYERFVLKVFIGHVEGFFYMNLFFVLVINYICWKISQVLFDNSQFCSNLTIIISFIFFPQLFFIAFAYGIIPGFCMTILAFYWQILFMKQGKIKYFLGVIITISVACIFKNNYLIGAIAIALLFLLFCLKKVKIRYFFCAVLVLGAVIFSGKAVTGWYEFESGDIISEGEPKLLWVAMGLRDNSKRLGGWYDAFNYDTYENTNYSQEDSIAEAKKVLIERADTFINDPKYALKFFGKKITSTWCDPLFQSIWSGPLSACNQSYKNEKISCIYEDGHIHGMIRDVCGAVLIMTYGMTSICLLLHLRKKSSEMILIGIVFFLGGFFFHLLWETKSQYVYPYVFCMIPYASWGVEKVLFFFERRRKKYFAGEDNSVMARERMKD